MLRWRSSQKQPEDTAVDELHFHTSVKVSTMTILNQVNTSSSAMTTSQVCSHHNSPLFPLSDRAGEERRGSFRQPHRGTYSNTLHDITRFLHVQSTTSISICHRHCETQYIYHRCTHFCTQVCMCAHIPETNTLQLPHTVRTRLPGH